MIGKSGGYIRKSLLTTSGDVIKRGATSPERLAVGAIGDFLFVGGSGPKWYDPWITVGDIPIRIGAGYLDRLVAGAAGKFLKANGAGVLPSYEDLPAGFAINWGYVYYDSSDGDKTFNPGFRPQAVIMMGNQTAADNGCSIGIGKPGSNMCLRMYDSFSSDIITDKCLKVEKSAGDESTAYITAFSDTGFTFNITNTGVVDTHLIWIALG